MFATVGPSVSSSRVYGLPSTEPSSDFTSGGTVTTKSLPPGSSPSGVKRRPRVPVQRHEPATGAPRLRLDGDGRQLLVVRHLDAAHGAREEDGDAGLLAIDDVPLRRGIHHRERPTRARGRPVRTGGSERHRGPGTVEARRQHQEAEDAVAGASQVESHGVLLPSSANGVTHGCARRALRGER